MTFKFEQLMEWARINIDKAEGFDVEYSAAHVNISMAYTLIAIAQELKKFNDRIDEAREPEKKTIGDDIRRGIKGFEDYMGL
jgi:hypothetical protein